MNETENNFNVDTKHINGLKNLIKVLVFLIYAAGALFATMAFYRETEHLFEGMSPLLIMLATVGAWANFASVCLMPWAKDHWVTGTAMMTVAVVGWAIEVCIMAANTLAAYGSTWAAGWVQLTPATPVFVIALWGLLWMLHPDHKRRQRIMSFHNRTQDKWLAMLDRAMDSEEVNDTMLRGAAQAAGQYAEQVLNVRLGKQFTEDISRAGKPKNDAARQNSPAQMEPGYASEADVHPAVNGAGDGRKNGKANPT